jgi:hypothetical protein
VQLGMHVPNACAHVSKVPDARAIMSLQDVLASSVVNACKACGHVGIVRLQCSASAMDHSSSTAIVPNDSTARRHTADHSSRGKIDKTRRAHAVQDIIATPSYYCPTAYGFICSGPTVGPRVSL